MNETQRNCPSCGRTVLKAARKCRHCRAELLVSDTVDGSPGFAGGHRADRDTLSQSEVAAHTKPAQDVAIKAVAHKPLFLFLLFGSTGFVLCCLYLLSTGERSFPVWFGIVFFGSGIPLSLLQLFNTRPVLIVSNAGITDVRNKLGLIAWKDVQSAHVRHLNGQPILCLNVEDEMPYLARLSPMMRKLTEFNRTLGFPPVTMSLWMLESDPNEIHALVQRHLSQRG